MLDNELHFLLLRAFNHSNRRIDAAIRAMGLLPGQPKIIECLAGRDGRTATDICDECILDKSTMTGLLKRMEDHGLVGREISETNRRSYHRVFLTALGRSYEARIAASRLADLTPSAMSFNLRRRRSAAPLSQQGMDIIVHFGARDRMTTQVGPIEDQHQGVGVVVGDQFGG